MTIKAKNDETSVTIRQREGLDASKDMSRYNRAMTYRDTSRLIEEARTDGANLIAPPTGISAFKLVCVLTSETIAIADSQNPGRMPVFGMTTVSADPSVRTFVMTQGIAENPLWSFAPRALLFASISGEITHIMPLTGILQVVGQAISATRIFLNISHNYIRRS